MQNLPQIKSRKETGKKDLNAFWIFFISPFGKRIVADCKFLTIQLLFRDFFCTPKPLGSFFSQTFFSSEFSAYFIFSFFISLGTKENPLKILVYFVLFFKYLSISFIKEF